MELSTGCSSVQVQRPCALADFGDFCRHGPSTPQPARPGYSSPDRRHAHGILRDYHSLAACRIEQRNSKFVVAPSTSLCSTLVILHWQLGFDQQKSRDQTIRNEKNTDSLGLKANFFSIVDCTAQYPRRRSCRYFGRSP